MHNAEITRRDFLRATLGLSLLTTSEYPRFSEEHKFSEELPPDKIHSLELFSDERTVDPLFNASTIQLRSNEEYGRGFLIHHDGIYKVATAVHVSDIVLKEGGEIIIPGVCRLETTPERFYIDKKHTSDFDPASFYVFGEEIQGILAKSVEEKKISPLTLVHEKPKVGEIVGVPSHTEYDYSYYRYKGYVSFGNLLSFEGISEETYNCRGDSGSPILQGIPSEESNEIIFTGNVYGVLQRSATSYIRGDGEVCFPSLFARAN